MTLYLNTIHPPAGAKKAAKRVGRGQGSGLGKTCGRGHKGQKSRSGGKVRAGFEGGQMPLQMRLPKFGFTSRIGAYTAEVRLSELNKISSDEVTLDTLKQSGLVRKNMKRARIFLSGEVTRAFKVKGVKVTQGAKAAIEQAGGSIE